jgi:aubergine-like protein
MAYDKNRHFQDADKTYNGLVACSKALNIYVEEPTWFELDREDNTDLFDEYLGTFVKTKGTPLIVMIVLRCEYLYAKYKNICYKYNVVSQVISARTCRKFNLSVASNVMRQVNSKLGGDLYNLAFSEEVSQNTMLIGIDVCHCGDNSIVGFCASINQEFSQYYSQKIVQKRGQEIVSNQLTNALKQALESFSNRHPKKLLPEHFIFYRDGVGDAMRKQVLQKEIAQFKEAIDEVYNKVAKKPAMTVIIVNKRIT